METMIDIKGLSSPSPVHVEQTLQEELRRKAYHQHTQDTIKAGTVAQRLPMPGKRARKVTTEESAQLSNHPSPSDSRGSKKKPRPE